MSDPRSLATLDGVQAVPRPSAQPPPPSAGPGLRAGMRPWGDLPGDDPERDREATEAELEAAGIDLHPTPPGRHAPSEPHGLPGPRPSAPAVGSRASRR